MSSLAADAWNYTFASGLSAGTQSSAKWPCSGSNVAINITIYIWRPSNGTKIATILDGASTATFTSTNQQTETSYSGTFSGMLSKYHRLVQFSIATVTFHQLYF